MFRLRKKAKALLFIMPFVLVMSSFSFLPQTTADETYVFTGHGYGHGAGLSMAGFYYLSKYGGWGYRDILNYYYKNVNSEARSDDQVITAVCSVHGTQHTMTVREYLYRLMEEPDSWPREGLRTLMVAARTYVWYKVNANGYMPGGQAFRHDLDPAKRPNIVAAVNDTADQVLTYDGAPIVAAYSASAGGWTAGLEHAYGGTGRPYLQPVESSWDSVIPNTYNWTKEVSSVQIEAAYPSIGTLTNLSVLSRSGYGDWGGRVLKIAVNGTGGSVTVSGEDFRSKLDLKSNWFSVSGGNQRRLYGATSHGTAVAISQSGWSSSKVVLLARDDYFSDALTGVSLAYTFKNDPNVNTPVPLLLTNSNSLSSESLIEMKRLGAEIAIVLGGPAAVSDGVLNQLRANGITPDRIWQNSPYGTAADIARRTRINANNFGSPTPDTPIVTTGENFADALAISSPAAANNMPIILVKPRSIPTETVQLLDEGWIKKIIIVGGPGAVHPDVEQELRNRGLNILTRLWGKDHYETAVSIVTNGNGFFNFTSPGAVYITRGDNYVDGVAGGALASRMNPAPVLLVGPDELPDSVKSYLNTNRLFITRLYILGGLGAVSKRVEDAMVSL